MTDITDRLRTWLQNLPPLSTEFAERAELDAVGNSANCALGGSGENANDAGEAAAPPPPVTADPDVPAVLHHAPGHEQVSNIPRPAWNAPDHMKEAEGS